MSDMKYYCKLCYKKLYGDDEPGLYWRKADFEKHLNSKRHLYVINSMENAGFKPEDINKLVFAVAKGPQDYIVYNN